MLFSRRKICRARWLPLCLFVLYLFVSIPEQDPPLQRVDQDLARSLDFSRVVLELSEAHVVGAGSLTAVLPVTPTSLLTLRNALSPLVSPPSCVSKVLVVCPEFLLSQARLAIRQAVRAAPESDHPPDVSLYPWNGDPIAGVLHAATQPSTKWLLLLDETDLSGVSNRTRAMLLCPVASGLPNGPRGVTGSPGNLSCEAPVARDTASVLSAATISPFPVRSFKKSTRTGLNSAMPSPDLARTNSVAPYEALETPIRTGVTSHSPVHPFMRV
ncbi:hypothetical protein B0H14DRAFT_3782202 [Mycena olivaceomarginata]|nr:hypothetical protein B0H14DRAFT_3782202 [Mycena olivaceomarginata]